jgi:transcriptional regulator GlxA family with amidase domain
MMSLRVGFLVYDGLQALDLAGPLDALGAANEYAPDGAPPYSSIMLGLDRNPVRAENGLQVMPDALIDDAPPLDTLIIPGGCGSRVVNRDPHLLEWIAARAFDTRRIASTCTGIYILAATGLLDGRRATTHWRFAEDVRAQFPAIRLDVDQLHIEDGKFHTSGGLSACLDLTLALIEADLGSTMALEVARHMVMYVKRPGNQAQFSEPLQAQSSGQGSLARLPEWLLDHLAEPLPVTRIADEANMSVRNFCRVFGRTFGMSPSRYVERLRLERSRLLLTTTKAPVERIASNVGFESADAFRRVFRRRYGPSPREYRERFGRVADSVGSSSHGQVPAG